jgi:AraC-like DNA-binding protein
MSARFDTNDAPVGQRFARWRDAASDLFLPVDVCTQYPETFRYRSVRAKVDEMPIGQSVANEVYVKRTRRHISRSCDDPISFYFPIKGAITVVQSGREVVIRAGEFAIVDTDRPYETHVSAEFGFAFLHVPRVRIARRIGPFESLTGLAFSPDLVYTQLAIDHISSVLKVVDRIEGAPAHRIAEQVLDLLSMAMWERMDRKPLFASTHRFALFCRTKDVIDRLLFDPELSLTVVAAAIQLSPRYVSALFSDCGMSYRRYVLEQRLARCARDLSTPWLVHRSVTEIALSWGFVDAAHFSRTFKAQYGVPPREYRLVRAFEECNDGLAGMVRAGRSPLTRGVAE